MFVRESFLRHPQTTTVASARRGLLLLFLDACFATSQFVLSTPLCLGEVLFELHKVALYASSSGCVLFLDRFPIHLLAT